MQVEDWRMKVEPKPKATQLKGLYILWKFHIRPEEYKKKVAEYVKKYATEDALRDQCGGEDDLSSSSESSMSDFSEDEAKDMEL